MNDFTKEELQLLYLSYTSSEFYIDPERDNLKRKLQSLIDNYCENESCEHSRLSPEEMLNIPLHCLDCGRKFE